MEVRRIYKCQGISGGADRRGARQRMMVSPAVIAHCPEDPMVCIRVWSLCCNGLEKILLCVRYIGKPSESGKCQRKMQVICLPNVDLWVRHAYCTGSRGRVFTFTAYNGHLNVVQDMANDMAEGGNGGQNGASKREKKRDKV